MIIDSHVHMGSGLLNDGRRFSHPSLDSRSLIAMLDDSGIDRAIVFPPIWEGGEFHDPTYERANDEVAAAEREFPDRIIGYARVNPNFGAAAVQEFLRCLDEHGSHGIMLHPDWESFRVTNPRLMFPIMEILQERGLPVTFHSGYWPADPVGYLLLAERFPDVTIIMKHMGYQLAEDAIAVAQRAPNLYLETAGNWSHFMAKAIRVLGAERVIYGSDAPYMTPAEEIQKLRTLPGVSEAELDLILGGNIARLQGLTADSGVGVGR